MLRESPKSLTPEEEMRIREIARIFLKKYSEFYDEAANILGYYRGPFLALAIFICYEYWLGMSTVDGPSKLMTTIGVLMLMYVFFIYVYLYWKYEDFFKIVVNRFPPDMIEEFEFEKRYSSKEIFHKNLNKYFVLDILILLFVINTPIWEILLPSIK